LIVKKEAGGGTEIEEGLEYRATGGAPEYQESLNSLKGHYHSQCIFNRRLPLVPDIRFSFDDGGGLHGVFTGNGLHQGYEGRLHGGVLAALVDASMAQCLMGHGITGYTTDLAIRYRNPVEIDRPTTITTRITEVNVGMLYSLKCEIIQGKKVAVEATGRFCRRR
jgi:acyl-coenzyme A thioesterase PaaI-like protein